MQIGVTYDDEPELPRYEYGNRERASRRGTVLRKGGIPAPSTVTSFRRDFPLSDLVICDLSVQPWEQKRICATMNNERKT